MPARRCLRRTSFLACAFWLVAGLCRAAEPAPLSELPSYLEAKDESFKWELHSELPLPGVSATLVRLTSQTWQGIPWQHWLTVLKPESVKVADRAMLLIAGGSNRSEAPKLSREALMLAAIAGQTGTVVAVLQQVPNQPLFGNLREDALIAHTFEQYHKSGDDSWPCLLPMVKSAQRAMDTVQAVAREKFQQEIARFFVSGASKRGWTTWLTAASDPRVEAIAPMVIDTLNMAKQMPHQLECFGGYSEQIADYTERGLQKLMETPAGRKLAAMVDPYSYRDRLTMPKLIVLGTNDPYWAVDAVNFYFDELQGEKLIHYVPNAGHGLGPGAIEAISAFYHSLLSGKPRPRFTWRFEGPRDGGARAAAIVVEAKDAPKTAELWSASAPSRDFRKAQWSSRPLAASDASQPGRFAAQVAVPERGEGFVAFYVRLGYESGLGADYGLCTSIRFFGEDPKDDAKKEDAKKDSGKKGSAE